MNDPKYDRAADRRRFIEVVSEVALKANEPGLLTLGSKDGRGSVFLAQSFKPSHTQRIDDEIRDRAGHQNIWLGLHLIRTDIAKGKRGGEADVVAVLAFVLDSDADSGKIARPIEGIEPAFINETSRENGTANLQIVYIFDRPLPPGVAKAIFDLGYRKCGGDVAAKDINHIWRVPGTLNHPDDAKIARGRSPEPHDVRIVGGSGMTVNVLALQAALEAMDDHTHNVASASSGAPVAWIPGGESDCAAIREKVPSETQQRMSQDRRYMDRPADRGDNNRSDHSFRVMLELMEHGLSDDEIYLVSDGSPFAQKFWKRGDLKKEISRARARWTDKGKHTHERGAKTATALSSKSRSAALASNVVKLSVVSKQPSGGDANSEPPMGAHVGNQAATPTGSILGKGFRYDSDGSVEYLRGTDEETGKENWALLCSPIKFLAVTRDSDDKSWGKLIEIQTPERRWHRISVSRQSIVTQGEEILGILAHLGLDFAPYTGIKNKLKELLAFAKPGRVARCVPHVGWHYPNGLPVFVLPDETFGGAGAEQTVFQPLHETHHAYRVSGTFEGWKEEIAKLAYGNYRLVLALCVAFAGPLLRLQGMEGGGFHLRGQSSTGKTTGLIVAGTVWGGGGQNGYAKPWRTTDNALEGIALAHCDVLLLLDELSQIDSRSAYNSIYMLTNGQGKGRLSKDVTLRQPPEWRILFISTGEISLTDKLAEDGRKSTAGQEVRFIDLDADAGAGMGMFEDLHGLHKPSDFADAIRAASRKHYGHAGREFLRRLLGNPDAVSNEVSVAVRDFRASVCQNNADGQVRRVAEKFAVAAAAGEKAIAWGILPWPAGAATAAAKALFQEWLAARGALGPREAQTALDQVRTILERDGASRFTAWGDLNRLTINRLGFVRLEDGRQIFYVLPEAFKNDVCKGLDAAFVARTLRDAGALITSGKKLQKKHRLPGMGPTNCYIIDGGKLFNPEGEDEFSSEELAA